jgi:hypothetical protein
MPKRKSNGKSRLAKLSNVLKLVLLGLVCALVGATAAFLPMQKEFNTCKQHFVRLLFNCQALLEQCEPCLKGEGE